MEQKAKPSFLKFRLIILGMVLAGVAGVIAIVLIAANDLPDMREIDNPNNDLSTQIYTSDGKLIRSFYTEKNRLSVPLSEISEHVLNALIAAEDIRFYRHSGIDQNAFFAIAKDLAMGKKTRGGSTISMQLARNLYDKVGRERTMFRKLKEMIVAVIIERKYTKEEILASYLNTVSFFGNTYGIENGAKIYFKKPASMLNPEEAAFLVGLLKGTEYYNPKKHYDRALNRRNTILNQMEEYGFLDPVEADSLKNTEINLTKFSKDDHNVGLAAYFTEHLRLFLNDWCKENDLNLYTDGLRVYTTIDSRMQKYAEEAAEEHLSELQTIFDKHIKGREAWIKDTTILVRAMRQSARWNAGITAKKTSKEIRKEFDKPVAMQLFRWKQEPLDTIMTPLDSIKYYSRFLETGFVSMDPSNGQIKAWVGGIDHRFFKYDHVYQGKRQVGSTFKPFVYTAAFDNGFTPCSKELNQPVFFYDNEGELKWAPKNADGKVGGYMTLRKGLATSTNLITARVMKKIGAEIVCQYARNMGIQTTLECVPSLALGTTDLSVYELTGAYGTFVNQGVWNEPMFITRIEDKNGNVLQEFVGEKREAINENTAFLMLNMLMGVVDERGGTAGRLRFRYKFTNQMGGKTGTTQNHSDGWFMGVTPYLVSGTWVGCSDRSMRFRSLEYGQGAALALPIFGLYMQKVYADSTIALPKDPFVKPRGMKLNLDCASQEDGNMSPFEEWNDTPEKKNNKSVMDFDE
ncbi:MAG: transglycosylase domain-containing protein [Bacteroidia bacterium]|nr:transglycosylase domain-containing protein [Bacteroidia bacterium]